MKAPGKVNYAESVTPPNYKCMRCGAAGCKLWREYQTFMDHALILCAKCAAKEEEKDISDIDAKGRCSVERGRRSDQIGWYVPAVPTEEGDSFWGYTSVPQSGCDWWARLPTLPA